MWQRPDRLSGGALRVSLLCLILSPFLVGCPDGLNPTSAGECNVHEEACAAILVPGVAITLDVSPKPVKAMTDLEFTVSLNDHEGPVEGARVELELTMPGMFMGDNRHVLSDDGNGRYRATAVLPRCPSGKTLWRADIQVSLSETDGEAWFLFSIK